MLLDVLRNGAVEVDTIERLRRVVDVWNRERAGPEVHATVDAFAREGNVMKRPFVIVVKGSCSGLQRTCSDRAGSCGRGLGGGGGGD